MSAVGSASPQLAAEAQAAPARQPQVFLAVADAATRRDCVATMERYGFNVQLERDTRHAFLAAREARDPVVVYDLPGPLVRDAARAPQAGDVEEGRVPTVVICDECVALQLLNTDSDAGLREIVLKPVRPAELMLRIRSLRQRDDLGKSLIESITARGEQARILTTLHEYVARLVCAEDLPEALSCAVSLTGEMMCARTITVWLPDGPYLRAAHASGPPVSELDGVRALVNDGWLGRVLSSGEALVIESSGQSELIPLACERSVFRDFPLILLPLRAGGLTVGVLSVAARAGATAFNRMERECANLLGGIVGTVIRQILVRQSRDSARDMIVFALAKLAECRDNETGHHLERVTRLSLLLAAELQASSPYRGAIDSAFLYSLERAAPLHDIGKVAIPDSILLKPGRLTEHEMSVMKTHTEVGWRALASVARHLSGVPFLEMAGDVAYAHHERFDGSGYPRGLSGEAIPLAARIVSLVDVYDALTSERPYKRAFSHSKAHEIIVEGLGNQFDPVVGAAFQAREEEFARVAREMADEPQRDNTEHVEVRT